MRGLPVTSTRDRRLSISERLTQRREDSWPTGAKIKQPDIGKAMVPPIEQSTVSQYEKKPEKLLRRGAVYAAAFIRQYGFPEWEVQEMVAELFKEQLAEQKQVLGKSHATVVVRGNQDVNVYATGTGPPWADEEVLETVTIAGLPPSATPYLGLKAMGNSMKPYLSMGDTAIILRDDGAVNPGDCCGIWIADDGCIVKEFVQELPDGRLLLRSYNPEPGESEYFTAPIGSRILGPVVKRVLDG